MAHQWMLETLKTLGLSKTSFEIYISLTIQGPQKRKEIADTLNIDKTQLQNGINQLQRNGLINMSLGQPSIFSAVPLDQALNSLVEKENKQADTLEKNRERILTYWRSLTSKQ